MIEKSHYRSYIETDKIEIRGKTLVFHNSIFQIPNITGIIAGSTTKPIPSYIWPILIVGGILLLIDGVSRLIGFLLLALAVGLFVFYWRHRKIHGLLIVLNSGYEQLIESQDLPFLKDVATVIREIMDSESMKESITFNLDQRTIIDNVTESPIVLGNVGGNVVNRI